MECIIKDNVNRQGERIYHVPGQVAYSAVNMADPRKRWFCSDHPGVPGLSLFGALKQADPALVDAGMTAQLECLLDDVVVGKQEMVSAIDAVCDVRHRRRRPSLARRRGRQRPSCVSTDACDEAL
jgi:hypothetical protein